MTAEEIALMRELLLKPDTPWGDYRTSVDAIEAATGLDLLNRIPAAVQAELEAGVKRRWYLMTTTYNPGHDPLHLCHRHATHS
jgi:DNA/RNA endonuclease G (NUC1)